MSVTLVPLSTLNSKNTSMSTNEESCFPQTLAPYPGTAAGEAIVHGLRIRDATNTKLANGVEGQTSVVADSQPEPTTDSSKAKSDTTTAAPPPTSAAVLSSATISVDTELVSAIFDGLARQHEQLVAQLTALSDVVTKDALDGVTDLVAAAEVLEDTFYRIDLLHAKVEYLNYFVAQPLSDAVKVIHKPKDLKGKAMSVLKSFGFKSSSSEEAEAEAMWSRIPPFVIINDPPAHPTAGPSPAMATPAPVSFTPNISLLNNLSDHYSSSLRDTGAAASATTTTTAANASAAYFQKGYTVSDDGSGSRNSVILGSGTADGSHGKNLQEFRRDALGQSLFIFEQSTARN